MLNEYLAELEAWRQKVDREIHSSKMVMSDLVRMTYAQRIEKTMEWVMNVRLENTQDKDKMSKRAQRLTKIMEEL